MPAHLWGGGVCSGGGACSPQANTGGGGRAGGGFTTVCRRTCASHDEQLMGSAGSPWGAGRPARYAAVIPAYRGETAAPRPRTTRYPYNASISSAYISCTTRRLSLSVGVSSADSAVHSLGSSVQRLTF